MNQILFPVGFWKVAGPLLAAVLAWSLNEWQKRIAFQYERKEANYKELIRKGYTFIETVRGVTLDEIAMGDFVAALRSDLLSRKLVRSTELAAKDFIHLTVSS